MYNNVPFHIEKIEQIEKDSVEARRLYPRVKRVFLVSGDPFVLKANQLSRTAEKVNHHLPEVETIAMYGSIANIASKSDEDLKTLRSLKINDLNIGLESGAVLGGQGPSQRFYNRTGQDPDRTAQGCQLRLQSQYNNWVRREYSLGSECPGISKNRQ